MRVLVTGAGGFVGKHMVECLAGHGDDVIAASHLPLRSELAAAIETFDIQDRDEVQTVINRHEPSAVVHLAAQASVGRSWADPATTYSVNVIGTSNLLEAFKDRDATRVVLIGSAQQYGMAAKTRPLREVDEMSPASPYAVSKAAQEMLGMLYWREFGLNVVAARPFNHCGPGQTEEYVIGSFCAQVAAIAKARKEPSMHVGRLDSIRDFLDVRDVTEAYWRLLEGGEPGEAYNVASGQGRRVGDLLKILLELSGLTSSVEVIESESATSDLDALIGDNDKIRSRLGWEPIIPIEQTLQDTLDWYLSRPNDF